MKAIIFDFDGVLIHSKNSAGNYLWQKNVHTDLGLTDEQMTKIYSGNRFSVMKGKLCIRQHLKQVFAEEVFINKKRNENPRNSSRLSSKEMAQAKARAMRCWYLSR